MMSKSIKAWMDTNRMSADYQHRVSDFVSNNVHYCVSSLVHELAQNAEHFPDYYDELAGAYQGNPDYEECAGESGWRKCADGEQHDDEHFEFWNDDDDEGSDADDWEELCSEQNLDPYEFAPEIYEHWIIDRWFAGKLETHGHKVLHDIMGLDCIWCRPTTGQSISMDGVVTAIYDELHRDSEAA